MFINTLGNYDENRHKYILANLDFVKKIYTFNDVPKKKKYIFQRMKKIYPETPDDQINRILDSIQIIFRKQDEKGASDHTKRKIYISLNEIKKYKMENEKDFINYLEHPASIITHETVHIFQNAFKALPNKKYLYKDENGDTEIDYGKYVTDLGEIESRVEQVIELLKWGLEKQEIVQFLYSRKYNDRDMWRILVDKAIEIRKRGSSQLPGDEYDDVGRGQGRKKKDYQKTDQGTNYEKDYLSSGHIQSDDKNQVSEDYATDVYQTQFFPHI